MIHGDTSLPGSSENNPNTPSSSPSTPNHKDPNHQSMSATSIYPPAYYPTGSAFDPNPPRIYRRPSQAGLPVYSGQFNPVSGASSANVSDHPQPADVAMRNNIGPPLPHPTTLQQFVPMYSQPVLPVTSPSVPMNSSISQPHPRIATGLVTPVEPEVHLDIVNHPVTELVTMLAAKLQNLITMNDRLKRASSTTETLHRPPSSSNKAEGRLLSFHARNIPSITITAYLNRILKYCPTDPEVFVSVLVYFDRILKIANGFPRPIFGEYYRAPDDLSPPPQIPPFSPEEFTIDSFNVHRLVITTIAVATKFFSDQFYTNSRYARVGGLPLTELNHLEIQFLILHDFNLMITPDEMQFYADQLLRYWLKEQQRQLNNSAGNSPRSLQSLPLSRTPSTPTTLFTPPPSSAYPPSTLSSSSTVYPQSQYSQPMEDVQSTNPNLTQPQLQ